MTDLPMTYAEYEPAAEVGRLIAGYWTFAIDAGAGDIGPLGAPPDGCVALTWRLGAGEIYLTGAHTQWRRILARSGDRMFGVRFWPGAAAALLPISPADYREQVVPANDLPGFRRFAALTRALDRCGDDVEAVRVADRHLAMLIEGAPQPDEAIMRTLARIVRACGNCTVAELARSEGLSPRQLRRRFLASAGLPPKDFARIWRWRCAAVGMSGLEDTDWTALAAEYGYADQPHMVREFRHAIGLTPKNYLRLIARVDYSRLKLTRRAPDN